MQKREREMEERGCGVEDMKGVSGGLMETTRPVVSSIHLVSSLSALLFLSSSVFPFNFLLVFSASPLVPFLHGTVANSSVSLVHASCRPCAAKIVDMFHPQCFISESCEIAHLAV